MSRIYFHSEDGDAELSGRERAYMGAFCSDLMHAALGTASDFFTPEWLKPFLPERLRDDRTTFVRAHLDVGNFSFRLPEGDEDAFTVALNTTLAIGNDPIKLMARLHGQCEVHCWVDGPDRAWLAGIMQDGRDQHIFRDREGWEGVIEFLCKRGDLPVVCSYSVCEQFPNFGMLPATHPLKQRDDEKRWDEYYDIPEAEKWALCLSTLKDARGGLKLTPGNWHSIRFGLGHTAFSLRNAKPRDQERAA